MCDCVSMIVLHYCEEVHICSVAGPSMFFLKGNEILMQGKAATALNNPQCEYKKQ